MAMQGDGTGTMDVSSGRLRSRQGCRAKDRAQRRGKSLSHRTDAGPADQYPQGELIKPRLVPIDSKLKHHFERESPEHLSVITACGPGQCAEKTTGYTEENGYLLNPQMKDEIDRIVASVDAPTQSGPLQAC